MEEKKQLKVWWIRNPPAQAEYYPVKSIEEAIVVLDKLATKDLKDPSVTSNASGLEEFYEGEWTEYYDEEGRDIDDIIDEMGTEKVEKLKKKLKVMV